MVHVTSAGGASLVFFGGMSKPIVWVDLGVSVSDEINCTECGRTQGGF